MKTDCSLSSFFSFRLVSLVSSFAKEETREMRQKNPAAKDIKRILSGGEVSRLHRDGEGLTLTHSGELPTTDYPLFLWQLKAQRKSLAKRNAAKPL